MCPSNAGVHSCHISLTTKGASGALTWSEAPNIIEAWLHEGATDDSKEGTGNSGRPRGAAPEQKGVKDVKLMKG